MGWRELMDELVDGLDRHTVETLATWGSHTHESLGRGLVEECRARVGSEQAPRASRVG